MNRQDNTFSTNESGIKSKQENKLTDQMTLALLKLVYYERKSIKQSSNYLNINYNTAKRIIKNFRRNKINLESGNIDKYNNLIDDLNSSSSRMEHNSSSPKKLNENKKEHNFTENLGDNLLKQIKYNQAHLKSLNEEIKMNQMVLIYMSNYVDKLFEMFKK
jgi:hypothetical protein